MCSGAGKDAPMVRVRHVEKGRSSIVHYSRCNKFDAHGTAFILAGGEFVFTRDGAGWSCSAIGPSGFEICHHYCVAGTDPGAALDAIISLVAGIDYCVGHVETTCHKEPGDNDFD